MDESRILTATVVPYSNTLKSTDFTTTAGEIESALWRYFGRLGPSHIDETEKKCLDRLAGVIASIRNRGAEL